MQTIVPSNMTPATNASNNTALLTHRYLFGLKSSVKNNIAFVEENVVVYPCGHNIVVHSIESKEQQFIHGMEGDQVAGITAMALTANRK